MSLLRLIRGDARNALRDLPPKSVECCITSPPYWGLRDYGVAGQIGLEATPQAYVAALVQVFSYVWRVLRDDGTCWIVLGDSYANDEKWGGASGGKHVSELHGNTGIGRRKKTSGLREKNLVGIPWRVAFALQDAGWYLRQDIIWSKPNPMPESCKDRCTKSHEYLFLLTKSPRYYFDAEAIKEPSAESSQERANYGWNGKMVFTNGKEIRSQPDPIDKMGDRWCPENRNKRSVWTVPTACCKDAHFAVFPANLIKPCILAGSPVGGTILDPFGGSGTTGQVALELGRSAILIELNPDYCKLADARTNVTPGLAL